MKEDKILNNAYNSGDIEYESFIQPMRVDDSVTDLYSDTISENLVEVRTAKLLDENIYELFKVSPYYEKYKDLRRVDKGDILKMYYYFKERLLKENTFSSKQIFISFAEFFQVSYDQLYSEVGVMDKEELLKELTNQFNIHSKIKAKKLF